MKRKFIYILSGLFLVSINCIPPEQFRNYQQEYARLNGKVPTQKTQYLNTIEKSDSSSELSNTEPTVKEFYVANEGEYCYLVIELNKIPKYYVNVIEDPDRLYVDLYNTIINPIKQTINIKEGLIDKIRTGQYNPTTARIVIDTYESVAHQTRLEYDKNRMKIYFYSAQNKRPNIFPEMPQLVQTNSLNTELYPNINHDGYKYHQSIQPFPIPTLAQELGLKVKTIIIDPGHGGDDPGAVSPHGVNEKDVVLDIALHLKQLIVQDGNFQVYVTRETDTFIPLEDRTRFANKNGGDLFVSIHANANRSSLKTGIETYYLSLAEDDESRAVAAYENSSTASHYSNLENMLDSILKNTKVEESKNFAENVQRNISELTRQQDRGVKKASFVVLIGANMPSILSEVGFLTNDKEEKLLKNGYYRKMIATAIFNGIKEYSNQLFASSNRSVD